MDAARYNSQQQSVPGGPNDLLRQARLRLTEATALLDRLCQLSSNGPESDQASDGSPLAYAGDAVPIGSTRSAGRPLMIQKHDMQAYQLWQFAGMPQAKIAAKLNEEHGTTYSQGQVSKMIRRACVHMKATGLQPGGAPARAARAVDPSVIELGKRTDGRRSDGRRSKRGSDDE